jgi:type I restriction enzyme R subunit
VINCTPGWQYPFTYMPGWRAYLDGTKFTADQIHFINLIINELTANRVMEPARLYESPYADHAPTGPEAMFPEPDVDSIVDILKIVRANAMPTDGAA